MNENEISKHIVESAIEVHRTLGGPGLLVEKLVIVEVKAITEHNPVFESQALTYLRLLDLRLALVINFGEKLVKDGIHRVVNKL